MKASTTRWLGILWRSHSIHYNQGNIFLLTEQHVPERDEAAAWRRPAPRFGRARPDGPGSVNSAGGEALGTFRGNVLTAQQYSYSDLEVFAC